MTHWLGKVFGGLTILATMVFILLTVFVFHTHDSWKKAVKNPTSTPRLGLEPQLALDQARFAALRSQKDLEMEKLALERGAARERLSDLETQIAQLEDEFTQREDELAKLTANSVKNEQVLGQTRATYDSLTAETQEAWERLRTTRLDADAQFVRSVQVSNIIAASEDQQRETQVGDGGLNQLGSLAHDQKAVMDKLDVSVNTIIDGPPPRVSGVVTDVSSGRLIEISRGADDGLQVGHAVEVFRGASYLGRATIRRVYPEKAVAEILNDYRKGNIQRGDRVTTRFN